MYSCLFIGQPIQKIINRIYIFNLSDKRFAYTVKFFTEHKILLLVSLLTDFIRNESINHNLFRFKIQIGGQYK